MPSIQIDNVLEQILIVKNSALFYTPAIYNKSFSYIFTKPAKKIVVNNLSQFQKKSKIIEKYLSEGYLGYSIIKYESGYLFENRLRNFLDDNDEALLQFYFFDRNNFQKISSNKVEFGRFTKNYKISSFKLNNSKNEFVENIEKIKNNIESGNTYQVNYTVKGEFNFSGDLINLFKTLIFNQSARYSAFINNGDKIIISVSPELFFHKKRKEILSKPMKGTLKRENDALSDNLQKTKLGFDEKNRSENLMIVDLIRNDLGKICEYGKVKVNNIFEIETYESLHQMVSTISGILRSKISINHIIKGLFPCGSITGAPKIRTMEIIKELEKDKRGIYTGSIGIIKRDELIFNVAIRTVLIDNLAKKGELGLGSGIVWDSDPVKEYEEVLLKSNFLLKANPYFELFETMLIENCKIFLLEEHLERLKNSASYFLFKYDGHNIQKGIAKTLNKVNSTKHMLRLSINKWGKIKIQLNDFPDNPFEIKVTFSKKKVYSNNLFQYHKTTYRDLYEKEHSFYSRKGFFDLLFFNENNQLTEGAISNIFIRKKNLWYTPPVYCGLLPGIYRNYFIKKEKNVKEKIIYMNDILESDEIVLTNSLRKKIRVDKLFLEENEFREF